MRGVEVRGSRKRAKRVFGVPEVVAPLQPSGNFLKSKLIYLAKNAVTIGIIPHSVQKVKHLFEFLSQIYKVMRDSRFIQKLDLSAV